VWGKEKIPMVRNFAGSTRAREIIQLRRRTILRPGGRVNLWEWWGFALIYNDGFTMDELKIDCNV
jgi:hypothetical protein